MYSVILSIFRDFKTELKKMQKMNTFFFANAVILFTNCTYSKNDIFSFGGKCIQSCIQLVFSRYSVLEAYVFSHVFSFRGSCIQFCE